MNKRLKRNQDRKDKLVKAPKACPSLSFRYLTDNKKFNFQYFRENKTELGEMAPALFERLVEITSRSWEENRALGKYEGGYEVIPYRELKFHADSSCDLLTENSQILVFRYSGKRYRILGFRDGQNPVYYIIGFDFDHDAYNHGA